jgi:poly(A) polymerase
VTVAAEVSPRIVPRDQHPISRRNISKHTLKVLYRLHDAGHRAYLVGGGVRDLMMGRQPKDFDVATSARPEEVRRIFRNARIIGRRFRLVHVHFHDEIVEVATFRRGANPQDQEGEKADLLITDDNTYGDPLEDAFRRDFTVNALFYNIEDFSVIDYVGGLEDLERKLIRVIGDPDVRFQEDPVRMLRACEFAGRLGFSIEARTQQGVHRHRKAIEKAAPARLTEELIALARCGRAGAAFQWALELGLLEVLMPEAYAMVSARGPGEGDFGRVLPTLDALVAEGRVMSDAGVLAALLLPHVLLRRFDVEAINGRPLTRAGIQELVRECVEPFLRRYTLAKQRASDVLYAILGFHRLCEPMKSFGERLRVAQKPYFADALLLFDVLVRATGEGEEELAHWQAAAKRRAASPVVRVDAAPAGAPAAEGTTEGAVRRRRRRRPRRR